MAAVVGVVAWVCLRVLGAQVETTSSGESDRFEPVPLTVGCRGAQCKGREANAMACDVDAASYADLRIGSSHVELRMSRNCTAAWARISYSSVGDRLKVQDRTGSAQTVTVADKKATDRYVVTRMLPAGSPTQVRACWEPREGGRHCTSWGTTAPLSALGGPAHRGTR